MGGPIAQSRLNLFSIKQKICAKKSLKRGVSPFTLCTQPMQHSQDTPFHTRGPVVVVRPEGSQTVEEDHGYSDDIGYPPEVPGLTT
jgi:hypothetical protein